MNDNLKLVLSTSGAGESGSVSMYRTTIEGNKILINKQIKYYNGTEPINVEVEREVELNENDLARIEKLMNDLLANKEQNEQHNNKPIMDASFTISGGLNGVDFIFDNNIELYDEVYEVISNIIKEKESDFYDDLNEEFDKLVEESTVYGSSIEMPDSIKQTVSTRDWNSDVEPEEEAKARLSAVLGIPKEEVPAQFVLMVKQGIDDFGPIEDIVFDAPRHPRKFTDEEIKQYATEERLNKWKLPSETTNEFENDINSGEVQIDPVKGPVGEVNEGNKKPVDILREKYPSFFDENGNLRQNSAELIDLLVENYANPNVEQTETIGKNM